ncbi:MAG: Eco57I restriction-modification methylase domain-containing protein [Thermoguttaceae bacterium]|nr:Eco57I restriction-modification methylase domain-containing protein [Thermoguttaceae bacterium]
MSDLLSVVIERTGSFLEEMPKSLRKKKGQFFTSRETAVFMAGMFDLSRLPEDVCVLDPGAGSGILAAALVDQLNQAEHIHRIHLTCYETDPEITPLLRKNLAFLKRRSHIPLEYELLTGDYILTQQHDFKGDLLAVPDPPKYDLIIANPPYLRVTRDDPAALAMPTVVHGAPNLYFLFASMSLFNLKPGAEMVYIIPRSWTSGLYFLYFRRYLFSVGKLTRVHLFASRDKVFKEEEVLQETMIIKVKKTSDAPKTILVTSNQSNGDFHNITSLNVPYTSVVAGKDIYLFLPTTAEEMAVIHKIHSYEHTLPEEGLRMRTGVVVDFRQGEDLRKEPGEHIVPLFYSQHIRDGRVHHNPSGKDFDWIVDEKPGLIQKNKNYVFCKRFTAKEEHRRLQCGLYLAEDFPQYRFIGTQNKINYVDHVDGSEMDIPTTYGVYALLNSTLFDVYYRVLNGSTQVNSTEVNSIPVPPVEKIRQIGQRVKAAGDLTTPACDSIVIEVAYA